MTESTLREALEEMFALINEGWLVRNTAHDSKENWAMRQVSALRRLAKARAALSPTANAEIMNSNAIQTNKG